MDQRNVTVALRLVGMLTTFFAICQMVIAVALYAGVEALVSTQLYTAVYHLSKYYAGGMIIVASLGVALFGIAPLLARSAARP